MLIIVGFIAFIVITAKDFLVGLWRHANRDEINAQAQYDEFQRYQQGIAEGKPFMAADGNWYDPQTGQRVPPPEQKS